ncbi:MAG: hypothetical protein JOZ67_06275 [Gammaproteobacteria bacterium]|nr:hypothetical protein [Gammaproteobacteria bacterium]
MKADVEVRGGDQAARLPQLASSAPAWSTDVFGSGEAQAEERVQAIIAANESGHAVVADDAEPATSELLAERSAPRAARHLR